MSHTLHRLANHENLKRDWIFLAMSARGINKKGSALRLRKFLNLAFLHNPDNYGDMLYGNRFDKSRHDILKNIKDESILHAVFSEKKNAENFLQELKAADLRISVVLSTLLEEGMHCAKKASIKPHTVSLSLGIWGSTELLPEPRILEITTMCGHGLISPALVKQKANEVAGGRLTLDEAVKTLAKPCVCGVFNPTLASRILTDMVKSEKALSQKSGTG